MRKSRLEPLFVESLSGRLFFLLRAPVEAERCVLFVPPFAEEMNKSRRQITEIAQALVGEGYATLVFDLSCTGDSEGDFADATWNGWKADVATAMAWAEGIGLPVEALVATRLGCALAAESLLESGRTISKAVFWQPLESGRRFMSQFLRLRVAASMMEADSNETVDGLETRLADGDFLNIAGYSLSPSLWRSIVAVDLTSAVEPCLGELQIIEIGRSKADALSPAGQRLVNAAFDKGVPASGLRIAGEPFWAATEIVTNPKLTELTIACLAGDNN